MKFELPETKAKKLLEFNAENLRLNVSRSIVDKMVSNDVKGIKYDVFVNEDVEDSLNFAIRFNDEGRLSFSSSKPYREIQTIRPFKSFNVGTTLAKAIDGNKYCPNVSAGKLENKKSWDEYLDLENVEHELDGCVLYVKVPYKKEINKIREDMDKWGDLWRIKKGRDVQLK